MANTRQIPRHILLAIVIPLMAGCATTNGVDNAEADTVAPEGASRPSGSYPQLTVNGADHTSLGDLVRAVGESRSGGGIVLVAGLEERPAPPVNVTREAYGKGLQRIAEPLNCRVSDAGGYQFVYPPGYEALLKLGVGGEQIAPHQDLRATFAVGAGTNMYNALALLSETMGLTIVADNVIADVWCGELFLDDAPLSAILEALLRSALVMPGAFVIESDADYLFIRSAANPNRNAIVGDTSALSDEMKRLLGKPVDLRLPATDNGNTFAAGPASLQTVLDRLSSQTGIPVSAAPALAEFPVNPVVFVATPASKVLDLMVRQWPVAGFGCQVTAGGARFVPRSG